MRGAVWVRRVMSVGEESEECGECGEGFRHPLLHYWYDPDEH